MNLITILDQLNIDQEITERPVYFLLFQEMHIDKKYKPFYPVHYDEIFCKESLNKYFNDEISIREIIDDVDTSDMDLPYRENFMPLIIERLEKIKELPIPVFNSEQIIVMKAILESINPYIPFPYLNVSLHKRELITLLSLTEWDYGCTSNRGWNQDFISISFLINSVFEMPELEISLPFSDMKKLMKKLSPYREGNDKKIYQSIQKDLISLMKRGNDETLRRMETVFVNQRGKESGKNH
ncbi:hypothetical protein QRD86_00100 (plasmid) [Bacillus halotolerans]|uniref:hypothetical protein n=1 Tax=Bacillus halotolerans TaxID=260554 RepID=UPI002570798D|nr:hypothetical protein [Bacillus halotolerans]WJE41189.1 hypothetical protein QRD86_00100 [Bacillus halotolerans]